MSSRLPWCKIILVIGLTTHLTNFIVRFLLRADFAALCEIVEQVEGVRFHDLFERLPKERAADGDAALQQVLALAWQVRTQAKPRSGLGRLRAWLGGWWRRG